MNLDITKFQEWLSSKEPDETVGFAKEACECPVARYLRETDSPDCYYSVGFLNAYKYEDRSAMIPLDVQPMPPEFSRFVRTVDTKSDARRAYIIEADFALHILEEVLLNAAAA